MSTEQTENEIAELLPLYALGCLDSEELAVVEQYLAQHPDTRATLRELEDGLAQLAHAAPPAPLPVDAKTRLMARVQADTTVESATVSVPAGERSVPLPRSRRSQRVVAWPHIRSVAVAMVIAGLLVWNIQLQRALNTPAARIAELAGQPNTQISLLVSTPAAPNATGRLYLTPDGKEGVLAVSGLPVPPAGQQYQFWFARPDKSRDSAAVFAVGSQGEALVPVTAPADLAQYDQIWITQEPTGGSAKPTPPHYMEGPLASHSAVTPGQRS